MPRLLYLRWAQWNALTPFFLIGGHDEHRPWKFDPEFFQIFRRYMWLHRSSFRFSTRNTCKPTCARAS